MQRCIIILKSAEIGIIMAESRIICSWSSGIVPIILVRGLFLLHAGIGVKTIPGSPLCPPEPALTPLRSALDMENVAASAGPATSWAFNALIKQFRKAAFLHGNKKLLPSDISLIWF